MASSFGRCTICTLPFEFDDITSLKCGHTYHHECILKWVETAKNCPKCRTKNTIRDITRLFIDETEASFIQAVPPTHAELEDMKNKLKKYEKQIKEINDVKLALELSYSQTERTNKTLKRQLDETRKELENTKQLKNQHIKHIEGILENQTELKKQIEQKTRQLKATEFYALISRKTNEADVEKEIDKYTTKNGDPSVGEFLSMYRRHAKQFESTIKDLKRQLDHEREEKANCQKKNQNLQQQIDNLKSQEPTKQRTQTTNGLSPASSLQHQPRPSLGFSFMEEEAETDAHSLNDDSIQILSSGPMPRPIPCVNSPPSPVIAFDFYDDHKPSRKFPSRLQQQKHAKTTKKPYLDDDIAELLSPNLHAHSNNENMMA